MTYSLIPSSRKFTRLCLLALVCVTGLSSRAMDTDIFSSVGGGGTPNVLIVIDNTSNWSRNNEKFPDGAGGTITQGQAETAAIRTVLDALPGTTNIGLMEFATAGTANDTGGYIRQAIAPMSAASSAGAAYTNKVNFQTTLTTIYNNITNPSEKINSGTQYGDLMWDAYNYYGGTAPSVRSAAVDSTRADSNGYVTNFTQFKAPVTASTICAADHIIFIGNPPASGPTRDTATNTTALTSANGGAFNQLPLPPFSTTTGNLATVLGFTSACYALAPTGTPTDYAAVCPGGSNATYDSCVYNTSVSSTTMNACPAGQSRYNVIATTPNTSSSSTVVSAPTTSTGATACYASTTAAAGDTGGLSCPASSSTSSGNTITTTSYACSYSYGAVTGSACPASVVTNSGTSQTATAATSGCYSNDNARGNDNAGLTCPTNTSSTNGGVTTATSYSCSYSAVAGSATGCSSSKHHFNVTQLATVLITTTSSAAHYVVTQTSTKSVTTATAASGSTVATLGNTAACYSSPPSGVPSDYVCPAGATCSYGGATTNAICPAGKVYQVVGNLATIMTTPTGGAGVVDTATYNADEWARLMNTGGFTVPGTTTKAKIRTHTIDVYGVQPNAVQSSLLSNMAHYGGGGYYTATNPAQISDALSSIFGEISATNSVFASAALPISATQRAQNDNQVYIGMFRPDQQSLPRWMGNLKRFQLGTLAGGQTDLVDAQTTPIAAINTSTGFLTPCAQSWWTTDNGNYWAAIDATTGTVTPRVFFTQTLASNPGQAWTTLGDDTALAAGGCVGKPAYSDLPDGAVVEKGGTAERIRLAASRKVLTLSGSSLVNFNTTNVTTLSSNSTVNANIVNFILGKDVTGEINGTASTSMRPSVHGAVIHSRPLPVDFGSSIGVKVYYGSNDGTFRAVDATTGNEDWAFVPTESYPYLRRLMDNTPFVQSPSPTPPGQVDSGGTPKDFFFDGSTGLYKSVMGSGGKTWIFPAMRRGGRVLHGFDVSDPTASPVFKWKVGCPNLTDDTGCSAGMSAIGQTWSTPTVVFLSKYSTTTPVLVVGAGYDGCEDADSASPSCSSPKGAGVYVLDASTGAVIRFLATDRSVAADVALIDANLDGIVDFAYVADTGGSVYRVNFSAPATFAALAPADWTITKVAYTTGSSRKFLFAPAVLAIKNQVYIAMASGDREHPTAQSYPYTTPVLNRAYVFRDDLASAAVSLDTLTNNTATNTCDATGLQSSSSKGWLLDLNAYGTGEQAVTSALITGGLVFFSTNRPTPAAVCGTSLGEARGYAVNLLNGSGGIGVSATCGGDRSAVFVGGGLAPTPVSGVVTVDGVSENYGIGMAKLDGSTSTPFGGQKLTPRINRSRSVIYWKSNTDTK